MSQRTWRISAGIGRRKVYRPAVPHANTETSEQAAESVRPIVSELEPLRAGWPSFGWQVTTSFRSAKAKVARAKRRGVF